MVYFTETSNRKSLTFFLYFRENVLLAEDTVKLADFGSCRGIYSKQPYTEYISTRWYRAPECLLTDGYYSYHVRITFLGLIVRWTSGDTAAFSSNC